jgi:hypothetical protein
VPGSKKNSNKAATFVTPMAAQSVAALPEGDDWLYEVKLSGLGAGLWTSPLSQEKTS